jgi:hypothetical protein
MREGIRKVYKIGYHNGTLGTQFSFIHNLSHNGFLVDGAPESIGSHDPKLHKKLCWRRVGGWFVFLSKILSKFFTVFSKYFSRHVKGESSS